MADDELSEAELREMLQPRRRPPQPVVKGRQWLMSDQDIAAFVRIVRELFPAIVFLTAERVGERRIKWELVPDPVGVNEKIYAAVPEGDWNAGDFCAQDSQPLGCLPKKSFSFWANFGPYTEKLDSGHVIESLNQGTLGGGHARSDRDKARFLARVWRAAEKVSTNKVEVKDIDRETGRTISNTRHTFIWFGFDALRWCLARENRMLEWRYRPTDDWEMPDTPYYD